MAFRMQVTQINASEIQVFLQALPGAMGRKVVKTVVEKLSSRGAKVMKKHLKRVLPHRTKRDRWQPTGALMASIGVKSPIKVRQDGSAYGVFGVRRNQSFATNKLQTVRRRIERRTVHGLKRVARGSITLASRGARGGSDKGKIRPSRYAHLVSRGHGGPIPSRAYDFMEPTINEFNGIAKRESAALIRQRVPLAIQAESRRLMRRFTR